LETGNVDSNNSIRMNIQEIKMIDIVGYLKSLNINPTKYSNKEAWFKSPFRTESTPSFKVNIITNSWFDFGEWKGGNILDLIMRLYNVDIKDALTWLSPFQNTFISQGNFSQPHIKEPGIKILQVGELKHEALLSYAIERGISTQIVKKYSQESLFSINGRRYFSLAFKNDKGGFELRNKKFKGSSSPKYITTIPSKDNTGLILFEGFFDFLSYLEYYRIEIPTGTCIVLNTIAFVDKVLPDIPNYDSITLFLDNDTAGKKQKEKIFLRNPKAIDEAQLLFPDFKDFNEFLMAKKNLINTNSNG
jgi:hypothetical protein